MNRNVGLAVLSALVLSGPAFAAHNLRINGKVSDTVTTVEPAVVSFNTESPGARANVRVFLDIDQDGQIDPGDPLLVRARMIDGDYSDSDQVANSFCMESSMWGMMMPGPLILRVEDGGVATNARLLVRPPPSGNSIAGSVLNPPHRPGLLVMAMPWDTAGPSASAQPAFGMTDSTGRYYISIPDSLAGHDWMVWLMDEFVAAPGYVSPISFDTVNVNGHVDSLDFTMDTADAFVVGQVRDDQGRPMPDSLWVFGDFTTSPGFVFGFSSCRTGGGGHYRLGVKQDSRVSCYLNLTLSEFAPDYLEPPSVQDSMMAETLITHDITVYHTDATITGHIYKDGAPANRIALSAVGDSGSASSGSYPDGHYTLRVSSRCSDYSVTINSLPEGYQVAESTQTVPPGATGVDFHLVRLGIQDDRLAQARTGTGCRLLPVASPARLPLAIRFESPRGTRVRLSVYDLAGKLVMNHDAISAGAQRVVWSGLDLSGHRVAPGVYFVCLSGAHSVKTQKVVLMK